MGNAQTELKDVYLFPVLQDRWQRYKQVYRMDGDFANALLSTDNLSLSKDMIRRLPFKHFYVDLERCQNFGPIKGMFVHVMDISDRVVEFSIYLITEDLLFFSHYVTGFFDERGIMTDDAKNHGEYIPYLAATGKDLGNENDNAQINRQRISFFALQLISYLTSKEPDTVPDSAACGAKPYQPGTRIRNKFSEITRHDVGVRVGNKIRVSIREMTEAKAKMRSHSGVDLSHGFNRGRGQKFV